MPFTLAHPAAAVPLARRGLVLSALVVGSMSPDFPYFWPHIVHDQFAHSIPGIFYFCIPAGLLVLAIFHLFLKVPLICLFPRSHQAKLMSVAKGFRFGPSQRFAGILLSLALGAFTHLTWDLVTHSQGWAVRHFPWLSLPVFGAARGSFKIYFLLQYGSTIAGITLLAYWYYRWLKATPEPALPLPVRLSTHAKVGCLVSVVAGALIVAAAYGYLRAPSMHGLRSLEQFTRYAVIMVTWTIGVELLAFAFFWHVLLAPTQAVAKPDKGR